MAREEWNEKAWRLTLVAVLSATMVGFAEPTSAQQRWSWPEKGENLQKLPPDFGGARLRSVMTGFTQALGVRCSHCHVGEEGQPLSTYDFASDENPKKNVARTMLDLLGDVNKQLDKIETSGVKRVNMWCHTCHRGRPRPTTLAEELAEANVQTGIEETIVHYRDLRERFHGRGTLDFGEPSLNEFGYELLSEGKHTDAIEVFRLNVEMFPESGNAYDSLAEAHMAAGRNELAIEFYEKSLEKNPENSNAKDKLRELRGKQLR